MKSKKIFVITFLLLLTTVWVSQSFALTKGTHQALNRQIANRTIDGFSLNTYLKDQLGFEKGVEEILLGFSEMINENVEQEVREWIVEGGYKEDEPEGPLRYAANAARNNRHFHNPLKDWDKAGLNTIVFTAQSLVLWAQNLNQDVGGKWSWKDTSKYFYVALTGKDLDGNIVALTKKERDSFFAKTFRALGQQMHLVQDASVPEHVRNDIHIKKAYEDYVEKIRNDRSKQDIWLSWLGNPIIYARSILDIPSTHPSAPVPISRIIDTDLYIGDNPNITKTSLDSSQFIGLAEYTNANFLSKDTMFTEDYDPDNPHYFPYPRAAGVSRWKDETNKRDYLRKTGEGDPVDHLALVSHLFSYRWRYFPQEKKYLPVSLDDECYGEYASKLMPRAVGYSAGLLEYFFRGKLDVKQTDTKPNGDIEITITNLSDEPLVKGVFALYYDSDQGDRKKVDLKQSDVENLPKDKTFTTTFPLPSDFDPQKRNQYMLVYNGQLGNEKGAVIGKHVELDYRGCMVVYHKYLRKMFFMTHDAAGNEVNFYIDLSDIIKPAWDTSGWDDEDWANWWRYGGPVNLTVLEYNALIGTLTFGAQFDPLQYEYSTVSWLLKFKVTDPSSSGESFTYNIGCEVANEGWQALETTPNEDYSWYGPKTSYPLNPSYCPYGLGEKTFKKYDFEYILQYPRIYPSATGPILRAKLDIWEENYGSNDLATLRWDFTYAIDDSLGTEPTSENELLCKVAYDSSYLNSTLLQIWVSSSTVNDPRVKPFYWIYPQQGQKFPWQAAYRLGGITTALNNNHKGVAKRWWEWEQVQIEFEDIVYGDFLWRYKVASPNDVTDDLSRPASIFNPLRSTLFKGLPGGGLEKRMMGVFHGSGSVDTLVYHYLIDGTYHWGDDPSPEEYFDPETYPFGRAAKELLVAFEKLNEGELISTTPYFSGSRKRLRYVPAVKIDSWDSRITVQSYPRAWHYYKISGQLKRNDGTIDTVYGVIASRATIWSPNNSGDWINEIWAPDGGWGDYRYISDYGLLSPTSLQGK